ncbi:NfeD family protein [Bacillus horti]|uniref:Membrane-bound ClpP family serine protease n=1 Tax=Caldalkalibacillus horti TaxID=77523 RepID=A0ABT9W4C1_9BACI|nr:NfeD family protein [Bacillus horti]MDQ0168087.1 membrane-bound ClpP family serine protease [Bacillus horti]
MTNSWYDFIFTPAGGFIVVFIGALFLFGEVLVKGRYVFGFIGLAAMVLYFSAHIQEGVAMWMGITFLIGMVLLILDGNFIGDGTVGGVGLLLMVVSLALPSPTIIYGVFVVAAFIIGAVCALLFPKFFPRRDMWSKLMLKDTLSSESGYNSLNESYRSLVGKEGVAATDFRPTGTIKIDEVIYSGVSEGRWIKKGAKLVVREVSGTRILVEPIESEEEEDISF